jgi:hypothetical protein
MYSKTATVLQAVGASFVSLGLGIIFLPIGFISAGVFTILFGLAMEKRNAR